MAQSASFCDVPPPITTASALASAPICADGSRSRGDVHSGDLASDIAIDVAEIGLELRRFSSRRICWARSVS